MPYSVWVPRTLLKDLPRRYPAFPLSSLLKELRSELAEHADEGRVAPFPYAGSLMQAFEIDTEEGRFRATSLYQIDRADNAVEMFEVGIVRVSSD